MRKGQRKQSWTTAQDDCLRECASQGADECRRELWRRFGVRRTRDAVKARASRLGVSLERFEACGECGRLVRRLKYSGLCELCHERSFVSAGARRARLLKEMEDADGYDEAVRAAKRARARERQRRHREKKCY